MNAKTQSSRSNRWLAVIASLAVGVMAGMMALPVFAGIPSESFTVTVTPTGDRGVIIGSATVALGNVTLGTSTRTVNAIPVTSTGTVGPVEYNISASLAGGWTLASSTSSLAENNLGAQALFSSSDPAETGFGAGADSGAVSILGASTAVGASGAAGTNYEKGVNMDDLALNTARSLFVRLVLPPTSSVGSTQTLTVTVTGRAP